MADQTSRRRLMPSLALALLLCAPVAAHATEKGPSLDQILEEVGIEPVSPPHKAPAFALSTLDGEVTSLEDFKGRMVLLHFWATWAPPASYEMAGLGKLQRALDVKAFAVLAVATDVRGKPAVEEFIREYAPTVPVLLDPEGETLLRYGIIVVPTSILIDGKGRVIGRAVGARPWDSKSVINALKKLVKAPARYGIIASGPASQSSERSR